MSSPEEYLAAAAQFDVATGDVEANLAAMRRSVEDAVNAGARLVVLPEMWTTSFLTEYDQATLAASTAADEELRRLSEKHSLVMVGSSPETIEGEVFNTARVYERGELRSSYRKIHRFSPNVEHRYHAAGHEPCIVDTELGRIGVMICYDVRFPELSRYYFHGGVEVLVIPGQWPEARSQHWRTLLRARAIENEVFVIGCNRIGQEESLRTGDSMPFAGDGRIIAPTGEILASGSGDEGAVVAPIELRKVRTMRRILPVAADLRPEVYRKLLVEAYDRMVAGTRSEQQRENPPAAD